MERETHFCQEYHRMRFNGDVTADSVDDVRTEWEEILERCLAVEIDLSGVRRIDLSGVQLMLQLRQRAKEDCKLVIFTGWNPAIEEALRVYRWFSDLIGSGRCPMPFALEGGVA